MSKNILDIILEQKRKEVKIIKDTFLSKDFERTEEFQLKTKSFKQKFLEIPFGIIAEFKRKSPSAGNINTDFNPIDIAKIYQNAGAIGMSILTDFEFFGGSNQDIIDSRKVVDFPILRKEFIVDEIQIIQAKSIGADAILLIAEALTKKEISRFTDFAHSFGLEVIMEFHEQSQWHKYDENVDIIGINNRNLKLQITDLHTSFEWMNILPKNKICISESGIKTINEMKELQNIGYKGALIGESILKNISGENVLHFNKK